MMTFRLLTALTGYDTATHRQSRVRRLCSHTLTMCGILAALTVGQTAGADHQSANDQTLPASVSDVPLPQFHLTATPWQQDSATVEDILDVVEGLCRFTARHQNADGAVIDPFLKREHQYSTPYFAFAVGALMHFDRASDLWPAGIRAMEHATGCFAGGSSEIPDRHGEFFVAPLTAAMPHFRPKVSASVYQTWQDRMATPIDAVMQDQHGRFNNWRTYGMKGEWLRAIHGFSTPATAGRFIRDAWLHRTQRDRIMPDRWNFYQDWSSDPQSHAVEAVGRGNLLALIHAGYDGPFHDDITRAVERGTAASLLWQDASGQCPPNGRTDNHVFNDVLYQLAFEVMAERMWQSGHRRLAGQFRQAAGLSFRSIARWRRQDAPWDGSFFVTKNNFYPAERVGYQPASQYTNYNGAVMYHLAECALTRQSQIPPAAAPVEIGGYVVEADPRFSSVTAAAGGIQMMANLRGDTVPKYSRYWTPLGVVRFSRVDWDSRLGPSDGAYDGELRRGITFGPTWKRGNRWVRLAEMAQHYRGTLNVEFAHPLLVRFSILYHTVTGSGGPAFTQQFVITPDGILTTLNCHGPQQFGLTLPVLTHNDKNYQTNDNSQILTVEPPRVLLAEARDRSSQQPTGMTQQFIALSKTASWSTASSALSTYGWLDPVGLTVREPEIKLFVRPARAGDPDARLITESWQGHSDEFQYGLARVTPTTYIGRSAAGGFADSLDIDQDGTPELQFSTPCQFMVQLNDGRIVALESDQDVEATVATFVPATDSSDRKTQNRGRRSVTNIPLKAYTPHYLDRAVDAESRELPPSSDLPDLP